MRNRADDLNVNWFKSSHSDNQGNACVEGGQCADGSMAVRDSKIPHGAAFVASPSAWTNFITAVNNNHLA